MRPARGRCGRGRVSRSGTDSAAASPARAAGVRGTGQEFGAVCGMGDQAMNRMKWLLLPALVLAGWGGGAAAAADRIVLCEEFGRTT